LRIAATSTSAAMLQGWLEEFNRLHPQITLALILGDAVANLLQDDLDLAIRFGVPQNSSMVARPLAFEPTAVVRRSCLCRRARHAAGTADLERLDCIVLSSASGMANEWRFERAGRQELRRRAGSRTRNQRWRRRPWAINGHGVVMKSIWDIGADLQAGRLQVLLPQWRTPDAPVHVFYQRTRYMAPRVRALLDFLVERFAQASLTLEGLLEAHLSS
jgi:DNA-binding transcriptional LysR family regulator